MPPKVSVSVVAPSGPHQSDCGYCKQDHTSVTYGMWAYHLTCSDYQQLIDRGWRRSGQYLYKPNLEQTCCPQYTIRLDSHNFKPSKSHKKVLKKVARYLKRDWEPPALSDPNSKPSGDQEDEDMDEQGPMEIEGMLSDEKREQLGGKHQLDPMFIDAEHGDHQDPGDGPSGGNGAGPSKEGPSHSKDKEDRTGKKHSRAPVLAQSQDWSEVVCQALEGGGETGRKLRIVLERSSFNQESFELYCRYQKVIHKDTDDELTPRRYKGFLVDSPLIPENVPSQDDFPGYGSFHQKYYLDDRLIAVGVIDILPLCVSSVYFYYDPDLSFLSLGVFSALHEIAFARKLSTMQPLLRYYYLGYYIHSCTKMRYKGQYKPSELLDPVEYQWAPLDACVPKLEQQKYTTFIPTSDEAEKWRSASNNPKLIKDSEIGAMRTLFQGEVHNIRNLSLPRDEKDGLKLFYGKIGPVLANKMVVVLD